MIDKQKNNWDLVAERIYQKYCGNITTDGFIIHCPCADHDDQSPSCKITPLSDKIIANCQVCDTAAGETGNAYRALKEAGDIPSSYTPYYLRIWNEAKTNADIIDTYLISRGLESLCSPALHVHESLRHSETRDVEHYAIIAALTNDEQRITGIHRTYLNENFDGKLDNVTAKKMLNGESGDRVVLRDGDTTLHIGEGLETTIAVLQNLPDKCTRHSVWAATSAGKLRSVKIPSKYLTIHIWADHDKNGAGIKAARHLAQRLFNQKRTVYIHLPDHKTLGSRKSIDWLDELHRVSDAFTIRRRYAPTRWEEDNITQPDGFLLTSEGLMMVKNKQSKDSDSNELTLLSRRQIWVSARCPSTEDDTSQCEITYYNPDRSAYSRTYISTGALCSTRRLHSELMVDKSNFTIDHKLLPYLCSYLQQSYEICSNTRLLAQHTGWVKRDGCIMHAVYDPNVELHVQSTGEKQLIAAFHKHGSYDKWRTDVLDTIVHCRGMSFVFASTLAAPLFSLFELDSIPVPMISGSGDGKSLSAHAALSAWCHPKKVEMSGSSSLAGLKNALGCMQDVPTLIDEVQLKSKESLGALIYDIGNSGKAFKANRDGGLRDTRSINTTTLFTGECSMAENTKQDGGNVRMIQLQDLDFISEIRDDPNRIKRLSRGLRTHYGHFGPEYVEELRVRYEDGTLQELYHDCEKSFETDDTFQKRQTARYAAMKTGCSILGEMLGKEYSTPLIQSLHDHWDAAAAKRKPDLIANRALQLVKDYVVAHRSEFGETEEGLFRESKGEWQADGRLAIIGSEFDRIIDKFDSSDVKRTWKKNGYLGLTASELKRGYLGRARIGTRKSTPGCVILSAETVSDIRPDGLLEN